MAELGRRFLERHPEQAAFVDPAEADGHAVLLAEAGIGALNAKVLTTSSFGPLLDVIAEHTAGVMLVRRGFTELVYEPPEMRRPVDFVGRCDGRRYAIEVKRLASSKHDDLQGKVMKTLNIALEADKQPVVISIALAESFTTNHINQLVQHVKATLRGGAREGTHWFPSEQDGWARYDLRPAPKRPNARVAIVWDVEMRDVTGADKNRVQHKIRAAYAKFDKDGAEVTNVVILQADGTIHLSKVSEALYGREYFDFHRGSDAVTRGRTPDGLLSRGRYSALDAVLVARRVAPRIFAPYDLTMFSAPVSRVPPQMIALAFGVERVIGPSDLL